MAIILCLSFPWCVEIGLARTLQRTTWQLIVLSINYTIDSTYTLFLHLLIIAFTFLLFSVLVFSLEANDVCEHLNASTDEHALPKGLQMMYGSI